MTAAHARLGPSAAHRWMRCPGSVRLAEQAEYDLESESEYATEGTQAHLIAATEASRAFGLISKAKYAEQVLHWKDTTPEDRHQEMLQHAADYVELLQHFASEHEHTQVLIEQKVDTGIPACWGTADAVLISPTSIHAVDYKYGKGIPVRAEHNEQLELYTIGALEMFDVIGEVDTACMTIHQPRLGGTSHFCMSAEDLRQWRDAVALPAAQIALSDDAYLAPSDVACRFCPVAGDCRARAEFVTRRDFGSPDLLSPSEVGQILADLPEIEDWCRAVRKSALHKAYEDGVEIPGWKVVRSGGKRVILDPDQAIQVLTEAGFDLDQVSNTKPAPLADLERAVGGKKRLHELLQGILGRSEGKLAMAPADDDRPAVDAIEDAAQDFSPIGE